MAGEVVSEGITVKEGWNRPVAPERLSAAERLEFPSKRVQFDPPEIKKKNQPCVSTDLLFCWLQGFNWTWHAAPRTQEHFSVAPSLLTDYHFHIY